MEVLATLNATKFSSDLELQRICLKGDMLKIVNVVKTNKRNWSRYG
jgi:hypothetical protein